MNSKFPRTAIVVLIMALVASVWLSNRVARQRAVETVGAPKVGSRAGFNKFLSQVSWMRLIQFRGSLEKVTKENASTLSKKLDQLTDLDPLFAQAYEDGAMDLAHLSPEEALRLLDKAMAEEKITSWKVPFIAGMIAKRHLKDIHRAVRYLEVAVRRPDHPDYVVRSLMHTRAEAIGKEPMDVLNLWIDYLGANQGERFEQGVRTPGAWTQLAHGDQRLALNRIAVIAAEIMKQAREDLAKASDPDRKKALQERITQTEKAVRSAYGNAHLCMRCFRPYAAGEKFCVHDGAPVEVYGVCRKDGSTIVHGAYCHVCGAKAN